MVVYLTLDEIESSISFMPQPCHTHEKGPQYPLSRRLCGYSWSVHSGIEKNSLDLPGIQSLALNRIRNYIVYFS
jgi:hypothetical protein